MTARFILAAQVLLTRRLKSLLRVDETTEIDQNYITCAEYQLFIDSQRAEGKNVQPDHWTTERFTPGTAKQPITGIRANDAVVFCDWLTQQQLLPGFRYRLPTPSEASEHPAVESLLGCWCQSGPDFVISGINPQQRNMWRKQLHKRHKRLETDFDLARTLDLASALDHHHDHDRNRVIGLARDLDRNLDRAINCAHDLDLAIASASDLNRDLNLAINSAHNLDLAITRAITRGRHLDRVRTRDLDHAYRYQDILIYSISLFLLWTLLHEFYDRVYKKGYCFQRIHHNHNQYDNIIQKCRDYRDNAGQLYSFLALIDLRRQGKMPAWESIRIVRERSDD